MSNLKFNKELVDNYKSSFDSAKTSFNNDSYNTFKNSYLATCSDSTVQSMYNNLDSLYSDIDRGYNSINDYWTNYNEDNSSLESSLKTDSNVCTNSNVNSFLSSFLGGVSNAQSPTIELYNGTKNSFESTNNSENTDDLVFRYNANTELSDQINIDDDLTYKPGEDSNNKELLNEETGYDDKIIEYGMTAEELEENLNNNLNDLELLYAEKFKELHKLEEELEKYETERMDYDPRSKEWDKSEELRNQIAEKKEELAAIKNQIQQTENQINLIPYYNLVYNDDYDEVLSTIDTEDIANYSMEELQSDYGVTKGAKGYNTLVDPLLVAESVKEHFPDKSDEELAFDYSILNISDESFTEMTYLDVYNYTTPEQRNIYHYLWKTQGREAADAYLLLLLDNINQSKGYYQAMQYISTLDLNDKGELETSLANYFDVSVKGLGDGIGTFYDGITENLLDDGTFTADEYEKMYVLYYLSENSDYYDEIYGFHSSVGNMLPAIAISMATSFVGTTFGVSTITIGGEEIALGELAGSTALGLSSYGNAKHEALHNGVSVYEANVYAICIGMSETLLDYKLGNIKWISKSSSMKFFDLAKEGFTEAAQEYIQQGLDYGLLGKDIDLSSMTADAGKSFLFGVLLSCYFNGSGKAFTVTYNGIKYTIDPKTSIEYFNENKDASLDTILNESSVGNEEATTLDKNNAPKDNQGIASSKYTESEITKLYETDPSKVSDILVENGLSEEDSKIVLENCKQEDVVKAISSNNPQSDINMLLNTYEYKIGSLEEVEIETNLFGEPEYYRYKTGDGVYIDIPVSEANGNLLEDNRLKGVLDSLDVIKTNNPTNYNAIKVIRLADTPNPDNSRIRSRNPHFTESYATAYAATGTITIWNNETNNTLTTSELLHESAHLLDIQAKYSSSDEYAKAVSLDGNFTSVYAKDSFECDTYNGHYSQLKEDYADFFKYYDDHGAEATKAKFPHRVEYFKENQPDLYNEMFNNEIKNSITYNKDYMSTKYDNNELINVFEANGVSKMEAIEIMNSYDKETVVIALCETDLAQRKNNILQLKVNKNSHSSSFLKQKFQMSGTNNYNSSSTTEETVGKNNAAKFNQGISSANTNTEKVGPLNTKFSYNKETISNMYDNNPNSLTVLFTMNGISDAEIMQIFNTYDKDTIVAALCETDEAKRNNNIKTLKINLNSKSDVNSFLQAKFTTSETNTFNKSNTNISNNKDYYDLKIDGLDNNPVLKEYANDYKQETKIDKNTGESIEKIISDDNYVYGVHRTPFVLWANDIYQNGIMLTGDSSSGAFKNTIDLEDNISFEKSKNEHYNHFMIYRDLSSSSYYKSFEEGSGYGMLVKIPKEYTTINEAGEITYDLEKLTYEKDGITYLKPEFIVGQVEAENGNLVDKGNTRFKE